ncbi:FAD-dependent oxidoreductase [Planctomicrobium sp. SH664]|uniref:FAD-dependent oxidoreductase n=1 Tax=Planctomicrobium sp. SH664 TaxID=3448125 RepID=UPI003F5C079C
MMKSFCRRLFPVVLAFLTLSLRPHLLPAQQTSLTTPVKSADVVIYGATPGGIAAAIAAARNGHSVLLLEPTSRMGGMATNGLSHPDFRTLESLSGLFLELNRRTEQYYTREYGADSQQVKDSLHGTHAEPKVALQLFREMLKEYPNLQVQDHKLLTGVTAEKTGEGFQISRLALKDRDGSEFAVSGKIFIDATYEGDLLALAKIPYSLGREGKAEYQEELAPAQGDSEVQGYNFRLCMTSNPENRVLPEKPDGYDREQFTGLLELIRQGTIKQACFIASGGSNPSAIYKIQKPVLPNLKHDVNDMSRAPVRLSLTNVSHDWAEADTARREELFQDLVRHNLGMLYFLQNDEEVPESIRIPAREFGLCRDEFVDSGFLPVQIYVREARRMKGRHVFTQHDVAASSDGVRAKFQPDAIAMGDYGLNCHGTGHQGPRFGGTHTGEFYQATAPYQIPYGVLLPPDRGNLLVPVAISSSHIGFCALRYEPIWMGLGEAAGTAAHLSLKHHQPLDKIDPAEIRQSLHAAGAATIYVSDVLPDSPDFVAVQWWGSAGGLHHTEAAAGKYGTRGKSYTGQYAHAFPWHEAQLNRDLAPELRERWLKLAAELKIDAGKLEQSRTRGDFIRTAYQLAHQREKSSRPNSD